MTDEVFHWKVRPDMRVESEPRVRVVKFGDGHEQRQPDGLNTDLKKYTVTLSVPRQQAALLETFLSRHGGVKSFLWTPPYGYRQIRVMCRKWSAGVKALRCEYSATFEQVMM
ncbi:phage tail protein [Enterobacter sp. A103]|uniref:phage tail protein n=1 Tax=Enterobacter sp. A103 TaxID=3102785 RepID=UPI002ACAB528|nr:phage tail protein [Enterobacter sp. A103]MDZ5641660.1 phage tail protein [Enterobacter sp. A103]